MPKVKRLYHGTALRTLTPLPYHINSLQLKRYRIILRALIHKILSLARLEHALPEQLKQIKSMCHQSFASMLPSRLTSWMDVSLLRTSKILRTMKTGSEIVDTCDE